MENHDSHDHGHDEGNGQTYSKGWWIPLAGLVTIALGFSILGGIIFGISGTDKWGKSEQCEKCEGKECKEGEACKNCGEKNCDGKCEHKGGAAIKEDNQAPAVNDSAHKNATGNKAPTEEKKEEQQGASNSEAK